MCPTPPLWRATLVPLLTRMIIVSVVTWTQLALPVSMWPGQDVHIKDLLLTGALVLPGETTVCTISAGNKVARVSNKWQNVLIFQVAEHVHFHNTQKYIQQLLVAGILY